VAPGPQLAWQGADSFHVSTTALVNILGLALLRDASDIHLKPGSPPRLRVHGRLERAPEVSPLSAADTESFLAEMMSRLPSTMKQDEFDRLGEVDFAHADESLGRFRVTAYRQRGLVSLVMRPVPSGAPAIEGLDLPDAVARLADETDGVILVAGPVGAGVSTTLSALVDAINRRHERNILTIEDPIEVLHTDRRSAVNQREVGLDTPSPAEALSRVARHDADVVMVGRLPDAAAVEGVLAAADGGALVLTSVRSADAGDAVERLVGMFPAARQQSIRIALASSLRAIVVQHLLPRVDGRGRVPAVGVLLGGPELRDGAIKGLDAATAHAIAAAGAERGMRSLDMAVSQLISDGTIEVTSALRLVRDPRALHQVPDMSRIAALLDLE
jgi:twitching motility protein PilT